MFYHAFILHSFRGISGNKVIVKKKSTVRFHSLTSRTMSLSLYLSGQGAPHHIILWLMSDHLILVLNPPGLFESKKKKICLTYKAICRREDKVGKFQVLNQ